MAPIRWIRMDTLKFIMDYEAGQLSEAEIVAGFQALIDSGLAWQLQGAYGRTAQRLIDAGLCSFPVKEPASTGDQDEQAPV